MVNCWAQTSSQKEKRQYAHNTPPRLIFTQSPMQCASRFNMISVTTSQHNAFKIFFSRYKKSKLSWWRGSQDFYILLTIYVLNLLYHGKKILNDDNFAPQIYWTPTYWSYPKVYTGFEYGNILYFGLVSWSLQSSVSSMIMLLWALYVIYTLIFHN